MQLASRNPLNRENTFGLGDPRRWKQLPIVLSATFMALFDFFVVNVAAPSIQRDLNASTSALQLVVGGYAFTYAAMLITGGRLGDRHGYRRLFVLGMAAFAAASAACGFAQTADQLIAARLCQGVAAAAMVPQVLALITASFPLASDLEPWPGLGRRLVSARLRDRSWEACFCKRTSSGLAGAPSFW